MKENLEPLNIRAIMRSTNKNEILKRILIDDLEENGISRDDARYFASLRNGIEPTISINESTTSRINKFLESIKF
jgi:hypothetical protein